MNSLFRNAGLFISGFLVAIAIYKSPMNIKESYRSSAEDSQNISRTDNSDLSKALAKRNLDEPLKRSALRPLNTIHQTSNYNSYSNGRLSLDSVPEMPGRTEDHIPTAPPTGRPLAEDQTEEDETQKDEPTKTEVTRNYDQNSNQNIPEKAKSISDAEASLSSSMPPIGLIGSNLNENSDSSNSSKDIATRGSGGGVSGGGGSSGGGRNVPGENTEQGVLPEDFTTAGLQIARRLFAEGDLSEVEYLEYLNLGLNSSESNLRASAINELVGLKTRNAFLLQAQFASSSGSDISALNQAIASQYRSASDLRFLSQIIADNSSVEAQSWAIYSLDVVLNSSNMDFSNPQIRDILVQNISTSLVQLDSNHPSFAQAQDISRDINNRLT